MANNPSATGDKDDFLQINKTKKRTLLQVTQLDEICDIGLKDSIAN